MHGIVFFPPILPLRFAIREVGFLHYPHIQLLASAAERDLFDVDIGHGLGTVPLKTPVILSGN